MTGSNGVQPDPLPQRSMALWQGRDRIAVMRSKLFLSLLLLLVLASAQIVGAQDEASDLLGRVNNLRASVGRAGYNWNGALAAAAQSQAQWIIETGNVSHTRPDGSGPRTRALNSGYPSTQVSENIYGGTNAGANDAWVFWVNSGIHYAGMVNAAYNDIGVGVAHGAWGAAYVLVFGNSGGPPPPPPQSAGSGTTDSGSNGAASAPPVYVLGLDENGNIMHEVQPGDTLGDIALIYGYTWADLPAMMALNGMGDVRDLEVGSVFLVPPKDGIFTPAPQTSDAVEGEEIASAPLATATTIPATITPFVALMPVREATLMVTPLIVLTEASSPNVIATANSESLPSLLAEASTSTPLPESTAVAMVGTPVLQNQSTIDVQPGPRSNSSLWIIVAVVVQLFVVAVAGAEYMRRARRRR